MRFVAQALFSPCLHLAHTPDLCQRLFRTQCPQDAHLTYESLTCWSGSCCSLAARVVRPSAQRMWAGVWAKSKHPVWVGRRHLLCEIRVQVTVFSGPLSPALSHACPPPRWFFSSVVSALAWLVCVVSIILYIFIQLQVEPCVLHMDPSCGGACCCLLVCFPLDFSGVLVSPSICLLSQSLHSSVVAQLSSGWMRAAGCRIRRVPRGSTPSQGPHVHTSAQQLPKYPGGRFKVQRCQASESASHLVMDGSRM